MNIEAKIADREVGYDVPAIPGMSEDEIQTPCLILDLDALERNIRKMGDYTNPQHAPPRAREDAQIRRRAAPATGARRGGWGLLPEGFGGRSLRARWYQGCTRFQPS